MMYPIVVVTLATGIVSFILIWIIPKFSDMFAMLGGQLPAPTQFLVDASNVLIHKTWMVIVGIVLLVIGYKGLKKNQKTKKPKYQESKNKNPMLALVF